MNTFMQGLTALAAGSVLLLSGCVASMRYQVAVPEPLPQGLSGEIHKDIVELKLPELTLLAQVQAFNWEGQYLLPPLGVWIDIEPQAGPVTIKTLGTTLTSDMDEPLTAVSYLGPDRKWFSPRAFAAGCGPRFYRSGIGLTRLGVSQESVMAADNAVGIYRPSDKALTIADDSCFMFWFDTDPLPNHTFVLSIDGLMKDGQKIDIPALRFSEGTVSTIRSFP